MPVIKFGKKKKKDIVWKKKWLRIRVTPNGKHVLEMRVAFKWHKYEKYSYLPSAVSEANSLMKLGKMRAIGKNQNILK